jgi:glutathione S-transferase
MDKLTLYVDHYWISPYALSAFVALEEKQLPFDVVELSMAKQDHRQPSYRSRTGRVPALQHGDFWLSESQAIAEYLAEAFPAPKHPRLFPADVKQRGICREVMSWLRSDLMPIRVERATHTVWFDRATAPLSADGQAAATRLVTLCEQLIGEGKTALFEEWCIADTDLAMMLQRLHLNGYPLPTKVIAYVEANWSRPSVAKWNQHRRPAYIGY